MKTLVLVFFLTLIISCDSERQLGVASEGPTVASDVDAFARIEVRNYELSLVDDSGICALSYVKLQPPQIKPRSIKFEFSSPCNFIRMPGNTKKPLEYVYGKNEKATVLIVVGGATDPSRRDSFQTNGCGTEIQAIRVSDNVIDLSKKIDTGAARTVCPSDGLDEVFYGTAPF